MRYYDVFNGDADGICALHQLRLEQPVEATIVTGLKRDIALLDSVDAVAGDLVTVLDLSMTVNRAALTRILDRGAKVRYFDHHDPGEVPAHERLTAVIDTAGGTCTSAIVDRVLHGRFRAWAIVGAFGDNQADTAVGLARSLAFDARHLATLRELGEDLNYNAYGQSESDVMVPPAELYRVVRRYANPFDLASHEPVIQRLKEEREADLRRALAIAPLHSSAGADAWLLPDAAWSRRVSGTFANRLARDDSARAHAVVTPASGDAYVVSLRSPREGGLSASEFCRRFGAGGGRAVAAGIDRLPRSDLPRLLDALDETWGVRPQSLG